MKHSQGWSAWSLVLTLLLLAVCGGNGVAQNQLTLTANSPGFTPNPAAVNEQVSASLSATVQNPPTNQPYSCPIQGPAWQWNVQTVALNGVSPPQAPYDVTLNSANSQTASLSGSFGASGAWTVTCGVQAAYSDPPCTDTWTGSATVTVSVNVVAVQLSPNPVIVPAGGMASVTVTTTPAN